MKDLPDDLTVMPDEDLVQQRAFRDERLAPLFRRWPHLSRIEFRELRTLYAERVRLAQHFGRLRRKHNT